MDDDIFISEIEEEPSEVYDDDGEKELEDYGDDGQDIAGEGSEINKERELVKKLFSNFESTVNLYNSINNDNIESQAPETLVKINKLETERTKLLAMEEAFQINWVPALQEII